MFCQTIKTPSMKTYNIIRKSDKEVLFSFQANEIQAKTIHNLRYDSQSTELEEANPFKVSDLKVIEAFDHGFGKVFLFSFPDEDVPVLVLQSGECYLLDENLNKIEAISFKELMNINAFMNLACCPNCRNRGISDVGEGDRSVFQECECENSNEYLQEIYNEL